MVEAQEAIDIGMNRQFISQKHLKLMRDLPKINDDKDHEIHNYHFAAGSTFGKRNSDELITVAKENAIRLMKELPPLQKAVKIIKPDTAKMIDRRDELLKKGQKLADELSDLCEEKSLSDYDQKMTIGNFQKMLIQQGDQKRTIVTELDKIGLEGTDLEKQIDKDLYGGIPGLSDALVNIINGLIDKCVSLGQLSRRVHEKVMFGDSKQALEILQNFERDELELSTATCRELREAVEKLGLSVTGRKVRTAKALVTKAELKK
jgi:hypothetical protein